MKLAVLVMTYTDPLQTERMVKQLQHKDIDVYIHLDLKFPLENHLFLEKYPNVKLIKHRTKLMWAGFSTIIAEFNCIKEILASNIHYDYITMISGQDYPIKSVPHILASLERHNGAEYIMYDLFDDWDTAYTRIQQYHFTDFSFKGRYLVQKWVNRLLPQRKFPLPFTFAGRSMFWTLTPACARYVVDFVTGNKELMRFFKFTWAPDEFLFQTIILNSPFKEKVINGPVTYFKRPNESPHPNVLTVDDYDDIIAAPQFFARKFNTTVDARILDKIDEFIAGQEKQYAESPGNTEKNTEKV
jgi:hypothetical protein